MIKTAQIRVEFNEPIWMYDGIQESIYDDFTDEEE